MTLLKGSFSALETREFPAGSFYIHMVQPMANATSITSSPRAAMVSSAGVGPTRT